MQRLLSKRNGKRDLTIVQGEELNDVIVNDLIAHIKDMVLRKQHPTRIWYPRQITSAKWVVLAFYCPI